MASVTASESALGKSTHVMELLTKQPAWHSQLPPHHSAGWYGSVVVDVVEAASSSTIAASRVDVTATLLNPGCMSVDLTTLFLSQPVMTRCVLFIVAAHLAILLMTAASAKAAIIAPQGRTLLASMASVTASESALGKSTHVMELLTKQPAWHSQLPPHHSA
eukprot:CAMPEP_0178408090 /NCGR_PEP_ID=MMETSP0689_2-20121128/19761_1 /TAXON_ID=160604 /ORGANISM="Amphidinium massartii, Strain CS-259" /LENGTH=161 /DNA_ID=CAMNT_0020029177 /DNA_START=395 /DNA_END=876 /DNA_ORIENTATION=+